MTLRLCRALLVLLLSQLAAGCNSIFTGTVASSDSDALLPSIAAGSDRIVLDVLFVRVPIAQSEVADDVFREVDEQQISNDTRRQLAQYGFRAGVAGTQLPGALEKVFQVEERGKTAAKSNAVGSPEGPTFSRQQLYLRQERRGEIVVSSTQDSLNVMSLDRGALQGRTYRQAQGVLAVKCRPQGDGRVLLDVVPELRHGPPRQSWVGGDGMMQLQTGQSKQAYEQLKMTTVLSPGQMLIIGPRPKPLLSLGRSMLTDPSSDAPTEKLLVIRLAGAAGDDSAAP